jgi:hypothetical protein
MAKEYRTAGELSGMIMSALAVKDVAVQVGKDHAYGWQPIVVASPGDLIGLSKTSRRNRQSSPPSILPSFNSPLANEILPDLMTPRRVRAGR